MFIDSTRFATNYFARPLQIAGFSFPPLTIFAITAQQQQTLTAANAFAHGTGLVFDTSFQEGAMTRTNGLRYGGNL